MWGYHCTMYTKADINRILTRMHDISPYTQTFPKCTGYHPIRLYLSSLTNINSFLGFPNEMKIQISGLIGLNAAGHN